MFGYFRPGSCLRSREQPFLAGRKTLQSFSWQSIKGIALILLRVWRIQETSGLIWWGRIWADSDSKTRVTWSSRGVDTLVVIYSNQTGHPTAQSLLFCPTTAVKHIQATQMNPVSLTPRRLKKQQKWVAFDLCLSLKWVDLEQLQWATLVNVVSVHRFTHACVHRQECQWLRISTQTWRQKLCFQLISPGEGVQLALSVRFQISVLIAKNPSPLFLLSSVTCECLRWLQSCE